MAEQWEAGDLSRWYPEDEHRYSWEGFRSQVLGATLILGEDVQFRADGERRWFVNDYSSLWVSMRLEERIRTGAFMHEAPDEVREEVSRYLDAWHGALPFEEQERAIICEAYRGSERSHAADKLPDAYREVPGQLRRVEAEVTSAGIRRTIRGRDMMRRWWAWRREIDEFSDEDSLARAKESIGTLAGRLIPTDEMPFIYYEVMGIENPRE